MVVNIFGTADIRPPLKKQVEFLEKMITKSAPIELKESIDILHNKMVSTEKKNSDFLDSLILIREELNVRLENLESKSNEQNEILTEIRDDLTEFKRKIRGRINFIANEKERINLQRIEASREKAINIADKNMVNYINNHVIVELNAIRDELGKINEINN